MDGSARVTFIWGDEERTFRLGLKELRRVQDKTGVGPQELYVRIAARSWKVDDLRETILQGLIGGGSKAEDAIKLVQTWVDDRPLLQSVSPALTILGAALSGATDDDAGKKAKPAGTAHPPAGSASAPLSEALPP